MKAYIIVEEWRQVKRYTPSIFLNKKTALNFVGSRKANNNKLGLSCNKFYIEEIEINEN